MILKLKGIVAGGKLQISGVNKKIKSRIPSYFEIEIDTSKIKRREKEK